VPAGSTWTTVAAAYAARGAVDDALVAAATAAGVGLVQVSADGSVSWSDEAYRLHGRPRWRRVRTLDDITWGLTPSDAARLRSAYLLLTGESDVEVRYAVRADQGPSRELVLHALDSGVALVHRAASRPARTTDEPAQDRPRVVVDVRDLTRTGDHLEPTPYAEALVDDLAPVPVERIGEEAADDAPTEEAGTDPVDDAVLGPDPETEFEGLPVEPAPDIASAVLSASPDLVVIFDLATRRILNIAGSEPEAAELVAQLASTPDQREGEALGRRIVHPDDQARMQQWRAGLATLEPDEVRTTELRFALEGGWRWRELRASAFVFDDEDRLREVVILVRDVHERIEAGLLLAERERAFREVFDSSPVGLAVLDEDGRFEEVNDAFCRLVGRTRENVRSTVYEALLHHEDRAAAGVARARRTTEGGMATATERRLLRSDGTVIWVRTRSSEIEYDHEHRTLLSVEDVTSSKAVEDRLRHDALHDALTGLPNRRLIVDRTERALARSRRTGTRLALFFIDLDDLKRVNDTHPWQHRAGDLLITSVAEAIRESLRDTDTLGRLGGDEFVAICEDAGDDATVRELGDRILAAVRQPIVIGAETVQVGASIGAAVPDEHETAEQLLGRADAAMYRAKAGGGSLVVHDHTQTQAEPALDLHAALDRDELRVHYRPVVSLATGAVLGVEAVIRCEHPERGWLPEQDVRDALDSGAGVLPVVHWSLAKAVSDVTTVSPSRAEHLSVWLSMPARAALAASTRRALEDAVSDADGGVGSSPTLVLGLHQRDVSTLMRRHALLRHLGDLTAAGPIGVGVVDFTADAVPLGTLRALDAVSVALDPALLDATREDRDLAELARSLVAGAEALGVITVAAGVESQEHLELARWLGVDAVSGDLIGPLAPLESWSRLLLRGVATLPVTPAPAPRRRPFEPRMPEPAPVLEEQAPEPRPDLVVVDGGAEELPADEQRQALEVAPLTAVATEPEPMPTPVEVAAPEPVVEPVVATEPVAVVEPEPAVAVEPEPVAIVVPEPVVVVEPVAEPEPVVVPEPEAAVEAEPEPALLLGDIGASLARELGIELEPEPDAYAASYEPATYEPLAYEPAPMQHAPVDPAPVAPATPAPSPYGGPMPGMTATPPAPGSFAGFTLPPSPFLMLRADAVEPEAAAEQPEGQS
jgi:diguanylate cyclase (GGDEF)-like protein/PAS domain S-box-containing protein